MLCYKSEEIQLKQPAEAFAAFRSISQEGKTMNTIGVNLGSLQAR